MVSYSDEPFSFSFLISESLLMCFQQCCCGEQLYERKCGFSFLGSHFQSDVEGSQIVQLLSLLEGVCILSYGVDRRLWESS